jgi:MFS transporter, CP family, cyanate transporter
MTATLDRPDPSTALARLSARARRGTAPPAPAPRADLRGTGLILAGIVLIAANLRLSVSSTGALLDPLTATLRLNSAVASLLTSIWPLAFAVGGFCGSWLARRFGVARILAAGVAALTVGSALRAVADTPALLGGSILAGLGIALANVLLPAAVRQYFPERIGLVTALYATALAGGSALAAGVSVPIANGLGGPELGLAVWALPAALALGVWAASRGRRAAHARGGDGADRGPAAPDPTRSAAEAVEAATVPGDHLRLRTLAHSKLAWALAAFFGLQSMGAYVVMGWLPSILESAGMSAARAGAVLSVTFVIDIPCSFIVPILGSRMRDQRPMFLLLSAALGVSFAGLVVAPVTLIWLWSALLGLGLAVFPMVLALFSLRGGSAAGTAALSTFAQSIGYLGAATAPLAVGILHDTTGSWTVPLLLMVAIAVVQGAVSLYVGSERHSVGSERHSVGSERHSVASEQHGVASEQPRVAV